MTVFDPPELLQSDRDSVREILVSALRGGYLSLYVGAGLSMSTAPSSAGLFPSWAELVARCCSATGVPFDSGRVSDNAYLREAAETAENACAAKGLLFADVVQNALYQSCPDYDRKSLKIDLLLSLGSLVMSSVRGSVSAVVSYNFDDLLEWYLELHGFKVAIVSKVPELVPSADVVVYHPHGFLPKVPKFSKHRTTDLIFGDRSYQRACKDSAWNEIQRSRFGCNICMFIGMSGEDSHVTMLFSDVHDQLKGNRVLGVFVNVDSPAAREKEDYRLRRGVLTYYLPSHEDLPDFLLDLCRSAADLA